jgi:hypothetical protein
MGISGMILILVLHSPNGLGMPEGSGRAADYVGKLEAQPVKNAVRWVETVFDLSYLLLAGAAAVYFLALSGGNIVKILYGFMAALLAAGDSFHLIPRLLLYFRPESGALLSAKALGKCAASITMTVFYGLLAHVLSGYFRLQLSPALIAAIWALAGIRIALCLIPMSQWTNEGKGRVFPVLRNIPFLVLGFLVAVISWQHRMGSQNIFSPMWLAILLSFGFYLPVVLFADKHPRVGMLMLPKTCMYLWMIGMGLSL